MIETAKELGADAVEIHTGRFANLKNDDDIQTEVDKINKAAILTKKLGMRAVAGHGLNYFNTQKLVDLDIFEEFNIGHSIISRAVFSGLAEAILTMKLIVE
jgi:pyridoxine 5-phosphate synthase